ncbi:hypothetical protein GGX14DRAFT_348092 [Mycena pura]|uniref:RNB domain-containing protein n=1 Tax=Mycena pura TaxID=153505 RepID=A0AAD7E401_9AGAR|nr:hypothetical protein GGX14DRAFT_348092 [Mycena pura]
MTGFAEQLVDTAALSEPPEGWVHTPRLGGTEKRLGRLIETVKSNSRTLSLEKAAFDALQSQTSDGKWTENEALAENSFTPGTFLELRRNEITTHGVVLGEVIHYSTCRIATLMSTGEVWTPLHSDVMFAVPALTTPDLAERCSILNIAIEQGQLNARIKVLQNIRQVERAVEAATADIIRRGLDVYSIVKSRDPNEWASTSVAEVARLFSPKPTLVNIFAVHKYLLARPECFVASEGYMYSQSLDVRPESHIKNINEVTDWCRQRDGPLQAFARRAIPVISTNRRLRSETRNDIPSQQPAKHSWTSEDTVILTFLHRALQPRRTIQTDPYSIGRNAILRELDPNAIVDDHTLHMALVDLGMYAPWQDVFSLRRSLKLDQEDPKTSRNVQATEALVERSLSAPARRGPLGPEDLHASDPLDHLRHDFGDMPVYVIDDPGAQELDDGISIEAVSGEKDTYWLHVHIADPASTVPATHILARRAAKQSQTGYFIHRSWPLFPKSLLLSGRPGFSLSSGKENRVLTFSSKINASGEVVDCVVRPGIARNLIQLTYEQVNLALTGTPLPRFYPVGIPPPLPPYPRIPDGQLNDLRLLTTIQRRAVQYRMDKGVIEPNNQHVDIRNFATPKDIESPTMRPSEFRGFPNFDYSVTSWTDVYSTAQGLVAEAMKYACRTASRWCAERGVDVLRRSGSPLDATPDALEKLRAMRDQNGYVDISTITAMATGLPSATYCLPPNAHWSLAIPDGEGYARATSPLRRYSDLLVHYQIHRALLGEKPQFSLEYLNDYKNWLKYDDQLKRRTATSHIKFWVLMALKRWTEAPRTDIPDPLVDLHGVIMRPVQPNVSTGGQQSEIQIPALGIPATLVGVTKELVDSWRIGGVVRVKVQEMRFGVNPSLIVTPKSTIVE